ncbi:MAG: flagellar biosynthesis protein FlhF [Gammaproteobacteria bacterium]|jgi:flagellar biosynthesis protein FlhF
MSNERGETQMKVRKYFAANMRGALEMVRNEQGPDVMILSNRKVDNGIELVTADGDIDDDLVQRFADQAKSKVAERISARDKQPADETPQAVISSSSTDVTEEVLYDDSGASLWSSSTAVVEMRKELTGLRGLLEQQLSGLAWSDFGAKHPVRARVLRMLSRYGIAPSLARDLVDCVPDTASFDDGFAIALRKLESRLTVLDDPILSDGGRVVLHGPTGAGKTLLACKLAVQYGLSAGLDKVAIVSTDDQRLGAQQQLKVFGSLLGISVYSCRNLVDLAECVARLEDQELVLVDTPGGSGSEPSLRELIDCVTQVHADFEPYLVLSASTDYLSLNKVFSSLVDIDVSGCVLTKLDEAAVLGPVVSAVVEANVPVAYLSAGQDIPDDLETPLARQLIDKTIALGGETPPQDQQSEIERSFDNQRGDH